MSADYDEAEAWEVVTYTEKKAAQHVLWVGLGEGQEPGSFFGHLIETMMHADMGNLARMKAAFPEYGEAVRMYKYDTDGVVELRRRASEARVVGEVTVEYGDEPEEGIVDTLTDDELLSLWYGAADGTAVIGQPSLAEIPPGSSIRASIVGGLRRIADGARNRALGI